MRRPMHAPARPPGAYGDVLGHFTTGLQGAARQDYPLGNLSTYFHHLWEHRGKIDRHLRSARGKPEIKMRNTDGLALVGYFPVTQQGADPLVVRGVFEAER